MELNVIRYCAEECVRQGKQDPMSTYHMCNAWDYAGNNIVNPKWPYNQNKITNEFIEHIGMLVEPEANASGFRHIPIFVGNAFQSVEKAPWERVPALLNALIAAYYDPDHPLESMILGEGHYAHAKTAEDVFYYEFENIHPFRDGNGRTGKILYNYLLGRMNDPIMPPNFWGSSNP